VRGAVIPILVFERAIRLRSSAELGRSPHDEAKGRGPPYVIQSFSATVRGRSKLQGEGLVSLKEVTGRPPSRLARCLWQRLKDQSLAVGD